MEIKKCDLVLEVWKQVRGTSNMFVSNMGRVKKVYKFKERIFKPYYRKHKPPYLVKVNGQEIKVAKLVYNTFVGEYDGSQYAVLHKVMRNDDSLINLILVDKKTLGKLTGGRTKKAQGIYKCKKEEKLIYDFYKSSREAAKKNYCSYQTILDICNGKTKKNCTGYDFVWQNKVDKDDSWKFSYE